MVEGQRSKVEGQGSRVEERGAGVQGRDLGSRGLGSRLGSRVEGRGSRVEGLGSRVWARVEGRSAACGSKVRVCGLSLRPRLEDARPVPGGLSRQGQPEGRGSTRRVAGHVPGRGSLARAGSRSSSLGSSDATASDDGLRLQPEIQDEKPHSSDKLY
eukprot:3071006-Rhodomonas_salina.4